MTNLDNTKLLANENLDGVVEYRSAFFASLVLTLFCLGLYLPTSFGGTFSIAWWGATFILLSLLLVPFVTRTNGLTSLARLANSVFMVALLLIATIFAPFPEYAWGGLIPYFALAILVAIDFKGLTVGDTLRKWFMAANVINLLAGLAVILHWQVVNDFLVSNYSQDYVDLVPFMTSVGKPVLTFGSHSIAAFFYYLFFLLNFETYKVRKNWLSLAFAIAFVTLTFALFSVSGVAFTCLAVVQLSRYFAKKNPRTMLSIAALVGVAASALVYMNASTIESWVDAGKVVSDVITSPTSGFLGRFASGGTLYSTVDYIRSRPFRPLGAAFRNDLMVGDSGFVEYYLRGSVLLLISVYGGLFVFLRRNLISRRHSWVLFSVIFLFESGYSSLMYFRTLYLLPVVVIYLNDLAPPTPSFGLRNLHSQ